MKKPRAMRPNPPARLNDHTPSGPGPARAQAPEAYAGRSKGRVTTTVAHTISYSRAEGPLQLGSSSE